MIRDTLKDLSKVAKVTNATVDLSVIQKQKTFERNGALIA